MARVCARVGTPHGAEIEAATLAFMAKMPAWKDHPRVRGK
jgi:hypothetical protein